MKQFLRSEAGAAVIWVLSALFLAAVISPWVYVGGKSLAVQAQIHDLSRVAEWLGEKCRNAKFDRFFNRCLIFSAVVLLPFLFRRVKAIRARESVIGVHGPAVSWQKGLVQLLVALVIATASLLMLGCLLQYLGVYYPNPKSPGMAKVFERGIATALIVACLEEWLFRGVMLGLWLRFAKPLAASIGCSLVFAFLHFLQPPDGTVIANPAAATAGFELLGSIFRHFADPLFFVTDFATLFVVGLILAGARIRTGKLWFSIGLHAGWILAYQGFDRMFKEVENHWLRPWGVGDSLRSGALPMITLLLTAVVCHFVLKALHPPITRA